MVRNRKRPEIISAPTLLGSRLVYPAQITILIMAKETPPLEVRKEDRTLLANRDLSVQRPTVLASRGHRGRRRIPFLAARACGRARSTLCARRNCAVRSSALLRSRQPQRGFGPAPLRIDPSQAAARHRRRQTRARA